MKTFFAAFAIAMALLGFGTVSSAFATEGYVPPVLNCESWEVPGWLNEHGDPSSCVDNAPCPEVREGLPCPADIPAPVEEPVVVPVDEPVDVAEAPVKEPVAVERPSTVPLPAPVVDVVPTTTTVPMLAETGYDARNAFIITAVLMGAGLLLVFRRSFKAIRKTR